MKILAIETSCDETSLALIEKVEGNTYKILSHETISQMNLHRTYGGVYPTLSKREHEKNLIPLLNKVLKDSKVLKEKDQSRKLKTFENEINLKDDNFLIDKLGQNIELLEKYPDLKENIFDFFSKYELKEKIDYIAVTNGPGLPPALWVGVNFAKIIAILFSDFHKPIPIYPINHLEGHIIGAIAKIEKEKVEIIDIKYPALCLLISGGHTELVLHESPGKYKKIGETEDDALGEAYDKVARLLNLPYPGGPEISKLAEMERTKKTKNELKFPRPMIHSKDLNFSFSGLKTHILYFIRDWKKEHGEENLGENLKASIAQEFEEAVKDVIIYKVKKALEETGCQTLVVGGGVAANIYLRKNLKILAKESTIDFFISSRELSTDNALMIALTCANQIQNHLKPTENFIAVGSKKYKWQE